jgi:hypothetical protein
MKNILLLVLVCLVHSTVNCQSLSFKEKTYIEISSLIDNAYEFLGKNDSDIISRGRPATMQEGNKWNVSSFDTKAKDELNTSKTVLIQTDYGQIMLLVSATTKVVQTIVYLAHRKAKVNGIEIMDHLKTKYDINERGDSRIKTPNAEYVTMSVLNGGVALAAWDEKLKKEKYFD